jgi:hypothetical protein
MSGAVKSGLIFALVGLVWGVAFSFIPVGGPLWGIPIALIVGAVAGYYGVRWSGESAGVGTGVLAGTIAGVGVLVAAVIGWIILFNRAMALPGFEEMMQERLRQQQQGAQLSPDQLNAVIGISGPIFGFCCGGVELVFALGVGALGGWLAMRNRPRPGTAPASPTPPLGPPPLDPPS